MEVIDPRNPTLCRVATVNRAEDFKVQVHFDGWPSMYDWWFDFDSMDLHPVGWCQKTGHVLEPPPCKQLLYIKIESSRNAKGLKTVARSDPLQSITPWENSSHEQWANYTLMKTKAKSDCSKVLICEKPDKNSRFLTLSDEKKPLVLLTQ